MIKKIIRIIDVLISIFVILIFFPIIFLISILIFIFDGRPIIFKQTRVGYLGKKFNILKFRTMKNTSLKNEKLRLTKLGKILRRTSLDELPQFINVLKKEMSIVGPRPLPLYIEEKIKTSIKIKRRKVLPGITGLSQINYTGKKRKLVEKIDLDIELVRNYNLNSYLRILIKTPSILFIRLLKINLQLLSNFENK